ncbi:hypothetical protein DB32_000237 [Sandaracinus amylolyticus]|uniref:Tryptophan synthase alpha chain n=2 Tax=Sandaracinus amylolyticus TaxID=927083 RepID=A0A0F6YG06_9BACT|nr:hypothetical protein DB32_000237 [Sandaracinus amylolyticus]
MRSYVAAAEVRTMRRALSISTILWFASLALACGGSPDDDVVDAGDLFDASESPDDAGAIDASAPDAYVPEPCESPGAIEEVACGRCGTTDRFCTADRVWAYGPCEDEGECTPGTSRDATCGDCGMRVERCAATCEWISDAACEDEGECTPGTILRAASDCPSGQTRELACSAACAYEPAGECEADPCTTPGAREDVPCGACGTRERFCTAERVWAYGPCGDEGECTPGTTGRVACGRCGTLAAQCTTSCGWSPSGACEGEGACTPGTTGPCTTSCGTTGTATCEATCGPGTCAPPAESCNGADDDCDGARDETFTCVRGATRPCASACGSGVETCSTACAWGACSAPTSCCTDADGDGAGVGATCAIVDCDDTRADVFPGAPELCDFVDNDCDTGAVDEGCRVRAARYVECTEHHWTSHIEDLGPYCAPLPSSRAAGCSSNGCALTTCGGTSCWTAECATPGACFTTYRRQEGALASLVRLYHWNEPGSARNRYTTTSTPPLGYTAGAPLDLGFVATTPIAPPGLAPLALVECEWTPASGGLDYFLTTRESECSARGGTIAARLGYVWAP